MKNKNCKETLKSSIPWQLMCRGYTSLVRGGAEGYSRYSLNTYFFAKKFLYFSDPRKWVFQQENLSPGDAGFDEKTLL